MVNLYVAMKIKQDKSDLLTKEYLKWYTEASDFFRELKSPNMNTDSLPLA